MLLTVAGVNYLGTRRGQVEASGGVVHGPLDQGAPVVAAECVGARERYVLFRQAVNRSVFNDVEIEPRRVTGKAGGLLLRYAASVGCRKLLQLRLLQVPQEGTGFAPGLTCKRGTVHDRRRRGRVQRGLHGQLPPARGRLDLRHEQRDEFRREPGHVPPEQAPHVVAQRVPDGLPVGQDRVEEGAVGGNDRVVRCLLRHGTLQATHGAIQGGDADQLREGLLCFSPGPQEGDERAPLHVVPPGLAEVRCVDAMGQRDGHFRSAMLNLSACLVQVRPR